MQHSRAVNLVAKKTWVGTLIKIMQIKNSAFAAHYLTIAAQDFVLGVKWSSTSQAYSALNYDAAQSSWWLWIRTFPMNLLFFTISVASMGCMIVYTVDFANKEDRLIVSRGNPWPINATAVLSIISRVAQRSQLLTFLTARISGQGKNKRITQMKTMHRHQVTRPSLSRGNYQRNAIQSSISTCSSFMNLIWHGKRSVTLHENLHHYFRQSWTQL